MLTQFYRAEPLLMLLFGNAAIWSSVFVLCAAFGHPLTHQQQDAIAGLAVIVSTVIGRQSVIAPDTHQQALSDQQLAQKLGA